MRCPECRTVNQSQATSCSNCGLLLLKLEPKRRADDLALKRRRSSDDSDVPCRFCGGEIPARAIRCRHCSEIVNDEFYRERARRVRSRINYASWVAYLFGLAALLVLRPAGILAIGCGLLLSIVYYAIPIDPPMPAHRRTRNRMGRFLRQQFKLERVQFPIPLMKSKKLVFIGTPLIAALIGYSANLVLLQEPMDQVLKNTASFQGMEVSTHYKYWVIPGVIEYDLEGLTVRQTPIDVHTALVEFATKLKEKRYSRVDLSYHGVTKFSIDGASFQRLGQEYARQNYDYVLYKFPKLLMRGNTTPMAHASDSDALLQFHRHWYGDDSMTRAITGGL